MTRFNYVTEAEGVVADGGDDTDAVIAEITRARTAGYGEIVLPAGVIGVRAGAAASDGCLNLLAGIIAIRGKGPGKTIVKLLPGQDTVHDVTGIIRTGSGTISSYVTLQHLTIDGNISANNTAGRRVIGFYSGVTPQSTLTDTDVRLHDVEVRNCSAYGFDPHERTTRLVLDHCFAHDNGIDGFTLDGCYGAELTGCYSYNNARHGFNLVTGSADCTLTGCHGFGNVSTGVTIQNGSKRCLVSGGMFASNTGAGIRINGLPQAAPELDTTAGVSNRITGCHINNNGEHGVHLVGTVDCSVVGNSIRDNSTTAAGSYHGVYLDESAGVFSTNNMVAANRIRGSHGYGIAEATTSENSNMVSGNMILGTTLSSVRLLGTATVNVNNVTM